MEANAAVPKDCLGITRGLSGTRIKIIGVIMMVCDHLYYMFHAQGVPAWFHWIGRPVAPLFLFMCAEGFAHTRSRKRYLLRLFIAFEAMNVISTVLGFALPNEDVMLIFSIFGSLFFAALYMLFVEMLLAAIRAKKAGKTVLALGCMIAPLVYGMATLVLLSTRQDAVPRWLSLTLFKLIPNIMIVEGNLVWVLMGVLFYLLRKRRILQIIPPLAFGAAFLLAGSIEWLVMLAAIPVLLYNGSRGSGGTLFFYIFYPAHIYLFYVIAYVLSKQ
jgi:hypothetical protein